MRLKEALNYQAVVDRDLSIYTSLRSVAFLWPEGPTEVSPGQEREAIAALGLRSHTESALKGLQSRRTKNTV